jgi:hypothetical protein
MREPKRSFREIIDSINSNRARIKAMADTLQDSFEAALIDSAENNRCEEDRISDRTEWAIYLDVDNLGLEEHKIVGNLSETTEKSYFLTDFGINVIEELARRFKSEYIGQDTYKSRIEIYLDPNGD